jgi:hypothetical protein
MLRHFTSFHAVLCHAMLCCAAVQYPDDEVALEEALDALLDNPDFLDLVADEVMFQVSAL